MEFSWSANRWAKGSRQHQDWQSPPKGKACLWVQHQLPIPGKVLLTWGEHCQASRCLNLAQSIASKTTIGALINGPHSLDLKPSGHFKPLRAPPKLEPEESVGLFLRVGQASWGSSDFCSYLHRNVGVIPGQWDVQAVLSPLDGGHGIGKHFTAKHHILPGYIPNVIWG